MTISTFTPPSVRCPKCDSQAVVEYKPYVYRCLKCDFERDLNKPSAPKKESRVMDLVMGGLGFLLMLALFL